MHVSGNFFQPISAGVSDYYFSHIPHIWGWATWRRSWEKYNLKMDGYQEFIKDKKLNKIFKNKKEKILWKHLFDQVFYEKSDTWDFQWTYALFLNGGLSVTPNVNLVRNIGFGDLAENCKDVKDKFANLQTREMDFPLSHPDTISANEEADLYVSMNNFGFTRLKYILIKLGLFDAFQKIYRKIKK